MKRGLNRYCLLQRHDGTLVYGREGESLRIYVQLCVGHNDMNRWRKNLVALQHRNGAHLGVRPTFQELKRSFYWPGM